MARFEFAADDPGSCEDRGSTSVRIMRYALLWFLGVPIPVLIVVYLLFH